MSFPKRRKQVKEVDRAFEIKAGIRKNDPVADLYAGGNVYSRADIEELHRHLFRRGRRRGPR